MLKLISIFVNLFKFQRVPKMTHVEIYDEEGNKIFDRHLKL